MRSFTFISIFVLISAAPTRADELPSRKPGLWEVKTSIDKRNAPAVVIRQCIDAKTDRIMMSIAGPYSQDVCPKHTVQRSADSTTIDSACAFAGKAATADAVVTGSFDSAYTMTVTSQSEAAPGDTMTMRMEAKWLGPCAADQKPGDMIFGNGFKANILDAQRYHPSPDFPQR
jgi:Protein of unknown function (DUF3617)